MAIFVIVNPLPSAPLAEFTNYNATASASGGTGPYTFSDGGTLPPSLAIDATTGVISGQLTQLGDFVVTITATDSLAATGSITFGLLVVVTNPSMVRNGLNWKGDECLTAGRQMARLIFNPIKTPDLTLPLEGSSNQPMGLIKSLIYSVHFNAVDLAFANADGMSFDVESQQNLMRVTLGVPTELLGIAAGAGRGDIQICGAVPFYCDSTLPVHITLNGDPLGSNIPGAIDARLWFCNFDVDPYTLNCLQDWSD